VHEIEKDDKELEAREEVVVCAAVLNEYSSVDEQSAGGTYTC
jgi:hypothetical protein